MATERSAQSGSPAIEIRDVYVTLDGATVLEAIDLTVSEHEFLGIIGPNGGGKTVLLKLLLGLIEPTRGTVRVLGGSPRQPRRFWPTCRISRSATSAPPTSATWRS